MIKKNGKLIYNEDCIMKWIDFKNIGFKIFSLNSKMMNQ